MHLRDKGMSILMKLLLSRATPIAALLLLIAFAVGRPAPRHQVVIAHAASLVIHRDPAPPSVSDHVLFRRIALTRAAEAAAAVPTPRRTAVVAARPGKKPTPPPAAPAHASSGTGQWLLINQDRAAAGLAPLQWSDCLANVATGQAQRMAAQGFISHAGGRILDLACHLGTQTGENIGYVGGGPNDAMMNSWFMGDAPHRANILGPYHYAAAAWVIAANGTAYLAVEFG